MRSGVSLNMFIDTNEGSDKDNNCSNAIHPCYSLEHVANLTTMAEYKQNISIEINSSIHVLINRSVEFHNVVDLSITGKTTNGTRCIVRCDSSEGLGISFNRCSNVALHNFTITGCGQYSANNAQYKVAVEMYNVSNLTVSGMVFKNNTGYGLLLNNSGGVIEVYGSWFINNSITSCYYGSGGMLIFAPWYRQHNNTVFNISHSHFYNNHNDFNDEECHHKLGLVKKGGGLQIEIFSNVTRNIFYVYYCKFKKNYANNGGGLYLEAYSISTKSIVVVSNCSFQNNEAYQGGGGADIGTSINQVNYHKIPIKNQFFLTDCYFIKNKARLYGGAVALFSSSGKDMLNTVKFSSCTFIENQANGGAAVDVNRAQNQIYGNTFITNFSFDSCSFIKNKAGHLQASQSTSSTVTQSGVFFTREVNVSFYGTNTFINNTNTALYCASAAIIFEEGSYTEFVGNTGGHGGAILLVDAQLSFRDSTTVIFKRNTAVYGGAICTIPLQTQFTYFTDTCFIQYHNINEHTASIMFDSNIATTGIANDIFASTLWPCRLYCHKCKLQRLFNTGYLANFNFSDGSFDNSSSVATAVRTLLTNNTILIFPGIPYHINVTQYDEFHHEIKALYLLSARLFTSHINMKLNIYSATLTNNTITVVGDINTTGTIILETIALSNIQKTVNVTIIDCPAGYYYDNSTYKCHCSQPNKGYYGISHCHINHSAIIDIGLWAGYLDRQFYTGVCSAQLCSYKGRLSSHGKYALPLVNANNKTVLEEYVCASNRQGTLCGICTDGYSTLYHSPSYRCSKCSDTALKYGILLYVASELLPVTAIFLVILLLDIRLTSGAFYTLIFYAQFLANFYINAFGTIHISEGLSTAASVYNIVYGILNLDILNMEHLSFCLWPNATVMHIFMIKYITTLYALLLIILTVLIMKVNSLYTCIKLCHRLGRRDIRGCIINALSAFLVLCYSQCIYITFSILTRVQLVPIDSSKPSIYVSLFNGQSRYMGGDHLYFAILAILCLVIIILPPLLILLIEPLLIKINHIFPRKMSYFLLEVRMKMKPFLDSFQGCFKDNCRVFAGLYFLYRITLYLPYLVTSTVAVEYMTAEGMLFVILFCHSMVQPFQNTWHNRLDICLLLNLLAINTSTIVSYYSLQWEYSQQSDTYVSIQLLLMTMPLIYICGYVCHYAFSFVNLKMKQGIRSRCSMEHGYSNIEDGDDSLPARLLNENMLPFSYNSLDS